VAFSPDGELVLTGSADKTARLWNARTGKPVCDPLLHEDAVWAVAFSPDGSRFATGGDFGVAYIWGCTTQERLSEFEDYYDRILALRFSPSGSQIAVGSTDLASVCDVQTGREIYEISVHNGDVIAVAFSRDGKTLMTASADGAVGIWTANAVDARLDLFEHDHAVWSVAFSPNGSRILTGGVGGIRLWDVVSRDFLSGVSVARTTGGVDFSPDGLNAVVAEGQTVRLREIPTLTPVGQPMEHDGWVSAVAFSPDGSQVLSASFDKTVKLWDGETGKSIAALPHPDGVRAAAFDADGSRILTGSLDNTAQLWDAQTGQPMAQPLLHRGMVTAVAFSRDGALVATGSADGGIQIWDSQTLEPVGRPLAHDERVNAIAFSRDGTYVATGTTQGVLRCWDWATGKAIPLPRRHERSVYDVAFSPDGGRIVSGSWDGTARLWDAPPAPVEGDVEQIVLWIQVITGLELDQGGTIHVLDRETWRERRRQLKALGGPPIL
jgi:WD40 repeat protein